MPKITNMLTQTIFRQ